jgi:hypothetical protein
LVASGDDTADTVGTASAAASGAAAVAVAVVVDDGDGIGIAGALPPVLPLPLLPIVLALGDGPV